MNSVNESDVVVSQDLEKPKTIVVCCDGTGNVGGAVTPTNVWRIRQSIAKTTEHKQDQIVLFQDGVGTSSFQPLEILGKAISWGITANLEDLYARFIGVYRPGDRVFLFGFSRGAFTARTFSNLLYECGVASCFDTDGRRFQAHEIRALARRAVQAYKLRHVELEDANNSEEVETIASAFRKRFGIKASNARYQSLGCDSEDAVPQKGRIPIEFIGVWDTVASVGLPFENTTQSIMRFWRRVTRYRALRWASFSQLNFQRTGHWSEWEDDLHEYTRNAYQALAIDDERQAFRPVLWMEFKACKSTVNDEVSENEKSESIGTPKENVNVQQAWFAGMHANVGGGYGKDTLAYVSLNWMMDHAARCGLEFEESTRRIYQDLADPLGQIANSREGLAQYYRYKPRSIEKLSAQVGLDGSVPERKPLIHRSVLRRIEAGADQYAPMGLPGPKNYGEISVPDEIQSHSEPGLVPDVADAISELSWPRRKPKTGHDNDKETVVNSVEKIEEVRREALEITYGYTRLRRGLYYTFFAFTLAFLGVGFWGTHPGKLAGLDGFFYRVINALTEWSTEIAPPYSQVLPMLLIVGTPPVIALIVLCSRSLKRVPDNASEAKQTQSELQRKQRKEQTQRPNQQPYVTPAELSDPYPVWTIAFQTLGLLLLAMILRPLAHWIVTALMPSAAEKLVGVLNSPSWFAIFMGAFYFILRLNSLFHSRMREWGVYAWQVSMHQSEPGAMTESALDKRARTYNDRSKWIGFFDDCVVPTVAFILLGILLAFPIWITIRDVLIRMRIQPASASQQTDLELTAEQSVIVQPALDPYGLETADIDPTAIMLHFDTSKIVDTAFSVDQNTMYVVAIERRRGTNAPENAPLWQDGTVDASSGIVTESDEVLPQKALSSLKRLPNEPYFRLVGSINDPTAASISIVPGVPFSVPKSGRLYLAVNDVPGFYSNNRGEGTIWIWRLRNP